MKIFVIAVIMISLNRHYVFNKHDYEYTIKT